MRGFDLIAAAALALSACSPYVQRGEALYYEGRFVEAAEVFELTEAKLEESAPAVRAEYGLYRGLTFLRLDDLRSARQWLAYAYAVERGTPGQLAPTQRAMLDRGWSELEGRTRAQPQPTVADEERYAASGIEAGGHQTAANGRRSIAPQ